MTRIHGGASVSEPVVRSAEHASRNECAFPDGQLYADLRGHAADGPADPGEILGRFLRALGAWSVPVDLAEQAATG
ncbi:hypothetical protein AB5J72_50060 [Streptomyces sp. CG1]|uniref:hypothetical protein n=1 Tax=Streptomyces sp. CG1 TaxID=1287523 RepID=UPI0034E22D40